MVGNTARKQRRMPMLIGILDVLEGRVIQVFSRFGDRKWGNEREVNLILVLTWAGGKWSKFEKKMHSRTPILICSSVWRTLSRSLVSLREKAFICHQIYIRAQNALV